MIILTFLTSERAFKTLSPLHCDKIFCKPLICGPGAQICDKYSGWRPLTLCNPTCLSSQFSGLTSWRTRSSGKSWRSTPSLASLMTPSMRCSTNTRHSEAGKFLQYSRLHSLESKILSWWRIWCLKHELTTRQVNIFNCLSQIWTLIA